MKKNLAIICENFYDYLKTVYYKSLLLNIFIFFFVQFAAVMFKELLRNLVQTKRPFNVSYLAHSVAQSADQWTIIFSLTGLFARIVILKLPSPIVKDDSFLVQDTIVSYNNWIKTKYTVPSHNKHTHDTDFSQNKHNLFYLTKMCLEKRRISANI